MKRRSARHNDARAYRYAPPVADPLKYFITVGNTMWLYPQVNVNDGITATPPIQQTANQLIFADRQTAIDFYAAVNTSTSASQPEGNFGYSLGIGTILQDLGTELYLIAGGQILVVWRLMKQLSDQETDVSVGGNSPNHTIGYITVSQTWTTQELQDNSSSLDNTNSAYIVKYTGTLPPV